MSLYNWVIYEKLNNIQTFIHAALESYYDRLQLIVEISGFNPIRIFSNQHFMKFMFTAECTQNSRHQKTHDRYQQTYQTMGNNSTKDGSIKP